MFQGRQTWVDFGRMELHVGGSSAVTVTKEELSKQTYGSIKVARSVASLDVTVPLEVKAHTIGQTRSNSRSSS